MNGLSVEKPIQQVLHVNSSNILYCGTNPPASTNHRKRKKYCPVCERRIFDVDIHEVYKTGSMDIETKCPHCNRIVVLSL